MLTVPAHVIRSTAAYKNEIEISYKEGYNIYLLFAIYEMLTTSVSLARYKKV